MKKFFEAYLKSDTSAFSRAFEHPLTLSNLPFVSAFDTAPGRPSETARPHAFRQSPEGDIPGVPSAVCNLWQQG
jgi:hypothetical protein